jgi:hypothetical protein
MTMKHLKTLAIVVALLLCYTPAFADTIGYTSIGASATTVATPKCTRFTAPANGDITKFTAHWVHFGTNADFRTAIYAIDGSDRPTGAALASSGSATTVTATGWYDSTISFTMVSGTKYCFAFWASSSLIESSFDTPGSGTNQSSASLSGVFPTWPTWTDDFALDRQYSIYATYTPTSSCRGGSMLMGVGGC